MTKLPHPGSLTYLHKSPFPVGSNTHCPKKIAGWKRDSMGFPWRLRTPKSEFGRISYDLPKLEVMQDPSRTELIGGEPSRTDPAGVTQLG